MYAVLCVKENNDKNNRTSVRLYGFTQRTVHIDTACIMKYGAIRKVSQGFQYTGIGILSQISNISFGFSSKLSIFLHFKILLT